MYTRYFVSEWPAFGREVGFEESKRYAEICVDRLRAELPDMAGLIDIGNQPSQGDPKVIAAIDSVYQKNWKYWIGQEKKKSEKAHGWIDDHVK